MIWPTRRIGRTASMMVRAARSNKRQIEAWRAGAGGSRVASSSSGSGGKSPLVNDVIFDKQGNQQMGMQPSPRQVRILGRQAIEMQQ
jgi:hypothetical protein